jgi:hypothetical protein
MHDSVGMPSICTVHAPQWPSLHAIFVPVRPSLQQLSEAHADRSLGRIGVPVHGERESDTVVIATMSADG